jgi:hypothetical protein
MVNRRVGPTRRRHSALDLDLTDDEVTALEEHYRTRIPRSF